jgi:hypothetical protein
MVGFRAFVAAFALLGAASVSQAAAPSCDITFRLGTSTPLVSASVFVIYQNAPGEFDGSATGVDCDLLNGTLGQTADADQTRTLTVTMVGTPNPIQGPKNVAKCKWTPTSRFPTPGDFDLSGQSGFSQALQPVNANITITTIDCSGDISTTTTTTTTTTTLPAQLCGDFDDNGVLQTSDALNVLKASVGQKDCALCICDLDGNGVKSATDALVVLKTAVGIAITLNCPLCS